MQTGLEASARKVPSAVVYFDGRLSVDLRNVGRSRIDGVGHFDCVHKCKKRRVWSVGVWGAALGQQLTGGFSRHDGGLGYLEKSGKVRKVKSNARQDKTSRESLTRSTLPSRLT